MLTVPNWSFYDPPLARRIADELTARGLNVHYCQGDEDHGRTVTAFSGSFLDLASAILWIADLVFPSIDLRVHRGVHPRIGALDVCPFIGLPPYPSLAEFAALFEERYGVPVSLYGHSGSASLTSLRRDGVVASRWGSTVMGFRDWLLAVNFSLPGQDVALVKRLAREIRVRRNAGDELFAGVQALGFRLEIADLAQLSLNFTRPDETSVDDVRAWLPATGWIPELIGVIREQDLPNATCLRPTPSQIISVAEWP